MDQRRRDRAAVPHAAQLSVKAMPLTTPTEQRRHAELAEGGLEQRGDGAVRRRKRTLARREPDPESRRRNALEEGDAPRASELSSFGPRAVSMLKRRRAFRVHRLFPKEFRHLPATFRGQPEGQ